MTAHGRRQSCIPVQGVQQILFDGSKTFWKTRSNLDILIVSHVKQLCIEIISYDADAGSESPRIYCSSMQLQAALDKEEYDRKLSMKKEAILRQRKTVDVTELSKEVTNEMLVQYIMTRLNVVVPALGAESSVINVRLVPLSEDAVDEEGQLQAVMACPPGLTPAVVNYQKKATLREMNMAMKKLNGETLALQQATRMAELVTSSVDGFKLMMAEKMRLEAEMKATFSDARMRWVRAINRVMIQNYVAHLHERLMNSSIREWYIKIMEAAAANEEESVGEDEVDEVDEVDEGGSDKDLSTLGEEPPESVKDTSNKIRMSRAQRNKQLRRSLDNSQLLQKKGSGTQFPILSSKSGGGSPTANSKMGEPLLPSLSQSGSSKGSPFAPNPMEKLRMERARHVGKNGKGGKKSHSSRLRRSFDDVASRGGAMATSPSSISIMPVTDIEVGVDGALCPPNEAPPSLLKSYSDNIPRLESPLRLTAFGDVSRSMRMKRMMEAK